MKDYPFKRMPGLDNVEVEKDETILLPDGVLKTVKGKTHKRGGEKVYAPPGTRVFSNYLKLSADVVEEITGERKKMTPQELSRKFPTEEYKKGMESKDTLVARTSAYMFDKNLAMQDLIFQAQESMKQEKEVRKLKASNPEEFQAGGFVDPGLSDTNISASFQFDPVEMYRRTLGENPLPLSTGVSMRVPNPANSPALRDVTMSVYNPVANDAFFTEGTYRNRGLQTGRNLENTLDYQEFISYPERSMQLDRPLLQSFLRQQANLLRRGERQDPDQFIEKYVVVNGQRIPLAKATDDQINDPNATYVYHNRRTGKSDLVDGRQGNSGEGTTNQSQIPLITTYYRDGKPVDTLPTKSLEVKSGPRPLFTQSTPSTNPNNPTETPVDPQTEQTVETPVGIDPELLYNGVLGARDVLGLASLRRNNPLYTFNNANVSTTRFDPINTLQNERAFNLAKEALEMSNVPESVKQAQLAQLQSTMMEGINQIDITNYQGNLANNNRNIERVDAARINNTQAMNLGNQQYLEQLSRSRYLMEQQRQEFIDRLTERWRIRMQNQMNLQLINQITPNYRFSPRSGVSYVPGSVPVDYNMLTPYSTQ